MTGFVVTGIIGLLALAAMVARAGGGPFRGKPGGGPDE